MIIYYLIIYYLKKPLGNTWCRCRFRFLLCNRLGIPLSFFEIHVRGPGDAILDAGLSTGPHEFQAVIINLDMAKGSISSHSIGAGGTT